MWRCVLGQRYDVFLKILETINFLPKNPRGTVSVLWTLWDPSVVKSALGAGGTSEWDWWSVSAQPESPGRFPGDWPCEMSGITRIGSGGDERTDRRKPITF